MKVVLQRVQSASVRVHDNIVGEIDTGLLIYLGICHEDTPDLIEPMVQKIAQLRIFADSADKMNLSLLDVEAKLLIVSQFTLCADVSKGRRPSFTQAKDPKEAKNYYETFVEKAVALLGKDRVQTGEFGAHMAITSINDGPVTFIFH